MDKGSGENLACPADVESSLRDRIAAALKAADKRVAGFISYEERADAVIEALGLRQETIEDWHGRTTHSE